MRYKYIESLRGFAAFWVVLYHLWNRFYPGLTTQAQPLRLDEITDPLSLVTLCSFGFGYSAVSLFFVLSGFCIHLPQARRGELRIEVGRYATRRFWRLYPAYLASVAFSLFALALPKFLLAARGRSFNWVAEIRAKDALISAAFLQQLWPESLSFNGVYWTLVYEVQFYAAYPLLLWCVRRVGLPPVGAALFACEVIFAYVPVPIACFLPAKYFEWFLGVVAAEAVAGRSPVILQRTAIIALVFGLGTALFSVFDARLYPLRDLLFAVGYFGLLLVASKGTALVGFLRWEVLVILGAFSYSLYLIHVPVIDIVWVGVDRLLIPRVSSPGHVRWLSMISIPLSIAVAYLFFLVFERPFLPRRPTTILEAEQATAASPAP